MTLLDVLFGGLAIAITILSAPATVQTGRISGLVVDDAANAPVPGARVFLTRADEPQSSSSRSPETMSDADGRYAFDHVAPGLYRLAAHKNGFVPPIDDSVLPTVSIAADEEAVGIVVSMQRGGVITGSVLDPAGQPADRVAVSALLKRLDTPGLLGGAPAPDGTPILMPFGQSDTNERGEFQLEGLPAGDYLVAAHPDPEHRGPAGLATPTATTYYPSTTDEGAAQVVSVQNNRTASNIRIQLAIVRLFKVSGIVVDDADAPVGDATIQLLPDFRGRDLFAAFSNGISRSAQSDANGLFVFGNIPPGSYTVQTGAGTAGIGASGVDIVIDSRGIPIAAPDGKKPPLPPGVAGVTVTDADVADLKLVAKKPQR